MITAKDILEIRRTMKKDESSIVRMKGCYVDHNGNKIMKINRHFMDLEDIEYFKYQDLAVEPYQAKQLENKVLSLDIQDEDMQQLLKGLIEEENEKLEDMLYDRIIDQQPLIDRMLILIFYGVYDIIRRANDGAELEDSEETYKFMNVVVCPVRLQKEGIQYFEKEKAFGPVEREWIVRKPEFAFIYPALDHRSADGREIMYYAADPQSPHHEIIVNALGCKDVMTAAEHKEVLKTCILQSCDSEDLTNEYLEGLNASFEAFLSEDDHLPERLNPVEMKNVMKIWMPEEYATMAARKYGDIYRDNFPRVELLYDQKARDRHYAKKKHKRGLELLRIAADSNQSFGATDIAKEIYDYLEGVR